MKHWTIIWSLLTCLVLAAPAQVQAQTQQTGKESGRLTTHVLDITAGQPGAGVKIALYVIENGQHRLLKRVVTNRDGRPDAPLLTGEDLRSGKYELVFSTGDYFAAKGVALPSPRFLDDVVIAFGVSDPTQHYHVPLTVSPWAYSTYRGS